MDPTLYAFLVTMPAGEQRVIDTDSKNRQEADELANVFRGLLRLDFGTKPDGSDAVAVVVLPTLVAEAERP